MVTLGPEPGDFVQLGKGPTVIANNVEITVLANQVVPDEQNAYMRAISRTATGSAIMHVLGDTGAAPAVDQVVFTWVKRPVTNVDFNIRHRLGASATIDWVAGRSLPE